MTEYTFHTECPLMTAGSLAPNDLMLVYDVSTGITGRAPVSDLASQGAVAVGAALTVTKALHAGKTMLLDTAAGSIATLPAATGSGARFRFMVSVLATSNSHKIQVANATDFFVGEIMGARTDSGNAVLGFCAANSGTVATNSDTITLNRTTTGSVNVGEWIEVEDVATATFFVRGMLTATGAAFATPFSAAV